METMTTAPAADVKKDPWPDFAYCLHCGGIIAWDEWSYTHYTGWANCRLESDARLLDGKKTAYPDLENPLLPAPTSPADAWSRMPRGWMLANVIADIEYRSWGVS